MNSVGFEGILRMEVYLQKLHITNLLETGQKLTRTNSVLCWNWTGSYKQQGRWSMPKPSLKIRSASAIFWSYLGKFRNYGLRNIFFRNKTFLFFKIESWNFQHLFEIEFRETSQSFNSFSSFSSFRQLLFSFFSIGCLIELSKSKQKSFVYWLNFTGRFWSMPWKMPAFCCCYNAKLLRVGYSHSIRIFYDWFREFGIKFMHERIGTILRYSLFWLFLGIGTTIWNSSSP